MQDQMNFTLTLMEIYNDWYKGVENFSIFPKYETEITLDELHAKIKRRFWLREIGVETPDRFLLSFQQVYLEWIGQYCLLKKALDREFKIYENLYTSRTTESENITIADGETNVDGTNDSTNSGTDEQTPNVSVTTTEKRGQTGRGNLLDTENTPYTATYQDSNYSSSRVWEKGENENKTEQEGSNKFTHGHKIVTDVDSKTTVSSEQNQNIITTEIYSGLTGQAEIEAFSMFMEKYPNLDIWFMDKLDECFLQIFI